MTYLVVTMTAVPDRFRGYMASVSTEVATGVFASDRISKAVRIRTFEVFDDWWEGAGSIVAVYADKDAASGLGIRLWGQPQRQLVDLDGILAVRR